MLDILLRILAILLFAIPSAWLGTQTPPLVIFAAITIGLIAVMGLLIAIADEAGIILPSPLDSKLPLQVLIASLTAYTTSYILTVVL